MRPYYVDEFVTLYHADCREALSLGLCRGADLLVTDPPYGINYRHGARKGGVLLGADNQSIAGDDEPFDPSHLFGVAPRMILWGGNHYASRLPDSRGWLVWDKRGDERLSNDQSDCELAWTDFPDDCTDLLSSLARRVTRWARTGRGQAARQPEARRIDGVVYRLGRRRTDDP